MIDGYAKVEVYEIDGKEPDGASDGDIRFLEVKPHSSDDGDDNNGFVTLEFEGKRLTVVTDELLAAVTAIKVISQER